MSKKGLGGKRCVRKSVSLTNDHASKSKMLAVSCNMSQAELLSLLIHISLNSPNVVDQLQQKYNVNEQYKVTSGKMQGKIEYF